MNLQPYFNKLKGSSKAAKKIQAVQFLAPLIKDTNVMDALCDAAINTTDHHLRAVLIDVLKKNPEEANSRFSGIALQSKDPRSRKWALVNLSLMGCGDANEAVIMGLNDRHASVRKAAAMSAGLYTDQAVLSTLEDFFEKHRFDCTISFVFEGMRTLRAHEKITSHLQRPSNPISGVAKTRHIPDIP